MLKKLLLALLLLPTAAFAQQLVDCAPNVPCTTSGPSQTGTGDPAWLSFGKINANFNYLLPVFGLGGVRVPVTGSGSLVLSNSPTLVTPNLGVPSFIDLTHAVNAPPFVPGTDISQAVVTATNTITARTEAARAAFHYNVMDFGAKGDVNTSTAACTMAQGSSTLVCPANTFASTDCHSGGGCTGPVDKAIDITGAGTTQCAPPFNCTLHTTITGFTSNSTVTTAATAANAVPFSTLVFVTNNSGAHGYAAGNTITVTGGTPGTGGVAAQVTLYSMAVDTIAVNAGGSGGAYDSKGYCQIQGTTGTGYKWVGSGTITAGALTAINLLTGGVYTANPTITGDGVTGCNLTGATVNVTVIPNEINNNIPGTYYTAAPANTCTTSGGSGSGLTMSCSWVQMGQATFYSDDTAAVTAAINQVNADYAAGSLRSCIYFPPGRNYGITAALPIFTGPGCVLGDASSWKTNIYIAPSTNGDIFSWTQTNQSTNASRITGGNTVNFALLHQGPVIAGLTFQGDRATTNHVTVMHFYDDDDYIVGDELNGQMIRGQFIKTGDVLNTTGAFIRESFFGHLRCDDCGDTNLATVEISAAGNNTGGAPTEWVDYNGYGNFGPCFWFHNEASGDMRGQTIYHIRCEGNQNNYPHVQADQILIGSVSPTLNGKVGRVKIYDATLTNSYYGYCAYKIQGSSTAINFEMFLSAEIIGGNPQGQGICINSSIKDSKLAVYSMNSPGPNLVVGPSSGGIKNFGIGDAEGFSNDSSGDYHYWTTSIDPTSVSAVSTAEVDNTFDQNYPINIEGLFKVDFGGNVVDTATGTFAKVVATGTLESGGTPFSVTATGTNCPATGTVTTGGAQAGEFTLTTTAGSALCTITITMSTNFDHGMKCDVDDITDGVHFVTNASGNTVSQCRVKGTQTTNGAATYRFMAVGW